MKKIFIIAGILILMLFILSKYLKYLEDLDVSHYRYESLSSFESKKNKVFLESYQLCKKTNSQLFHVEDVWTENIPRYKDDKFVEVSSGLEKNFVLNVKYDRNDLFTEDSLDITRFTMENCLISGKKAGQLFFVKEKFENTVKIEFCLSDDCSNHENKSNCVLQVLEFKKIDRSDVSGIRP